MRSVPNERRDGTSDVARPGVRRWKCFHPVDVESPCPSGGDRRVQQRSVRCLLFVDPAWCGATLNGLVGMDLDRTQRLLKTSRSISLRHSGPGLALSTMWLFPQPLDNCLREGLFFWAGSTAVWWTGLGGWARAVQVRLQLRSADFGNVSGCLTGFRVRLILTESLTGEPRAHRSFLLREA